MAHKKVEEILEAITPVDDAKAQDPETSIGPDIPNVTFGLSDMMAKGEAMNLDEYLANHCFSIGPAMAQQQQKPSICRSVFYHDTWKNGKIYPAIIVAVWSDTVVDLAYIDIDQNPCLIPVRGVHLSEDGTGIGKWSWPPIAD